MFLKLIAKEVSPFKPNTEVFNGETERRFTELDIQNCRKHNNNMIIVSGLIDWGSDQNYNPIIADSVYWDFECCDLSEFEICPIEDSGEEIYRKLIKRYRAQ